MFPIDDITLDAVEHALGGWLRCTDPDNPELVGADYSLHQLFDFLSGHNEELDYEEDEYTIRTQQIYSEKDLILALIAEIRRLRG